MFLLSKYKSFVTLSQIELVVKLLLPSKLLEWQRFIPDSLYVLFDLFELISPLILPFERAKALHVKLRVTLSNEGQHVELVSFLS